MDPKQFKDFCDEWKRKGALDFTRKSHYEPMAPLFEAHAEVVEVTVKDFHNLGKGWDAEAKKEFTTYYPKKETIDKFSIAAGFSFASVDIGTRKDSPSTYVGKAQVKMLGPDGEGLPKPQYTMNGLNEVIKFISYSNKYSPMTISLKIPTLSRNVRLACKIFDFSSFELPCPFYIFLIILRSVYFRSFRQSPLDRVALGFQVVP